MTVAAANQGSGGEGMGMGLGFALASRLGANLESHNIKTDHNPPPVPASIQWYIVVDNKRAGPYDLKELSSQFDQLNLNSKTLVWRAGLNGWTEASQIKELAFISNLTPPPIPN